MSKHTPGPWAADSPDDGRVSIIAADGDSIGHAEGRNQPDDIANARLIASAPELLAACKEILPVLEAMQRLAIAQKWPGARTDNTDGPAIMAIRAAIAKAEGVDTQTRSGT